MSGASDTPPMPGLAGHPADVEALARQASELLDRDRVAQARGLLAQALKEHPQHAALLYESARTEVLGNDFTAASDTLGQLLRVEPSHVPGRLLQFHLEQHAGRLAHAEEIILGLLREDPAQATFYATYARLMLRTLNFAKAARLADEALRLDPQLHAALRTRALCDLVLLPCGQHSPALLKLIAEDPGDLHTMRLVVVALVEARRPREAHQLARELLRAHPTDASMLELVRALHVDTHWSLLPLWPLQRWGWNASIALWGLSVVGLRWLAHAAPQWAVPVAVGVIGYVAYSWIWPPLLRRFLSR